MSSGDVKRIVEQDELPQDRVVGAAPAGAKDEASAAVAVREMFSSIAPRYDLLNHVLSMNVDRLWWNRTARIFDDVLNRPNVQVLDLCCGTGDMTFALQRRMRGGSGRLTGADFAHPMLVRAREKSAGRDIRWVEADALKLAFRSRPIRPGDGRVRVSQPGKLQPRTGGDISRARARMVKLGFWISASPRD